MVDMPSNQTKPKDPKCLTLIKYSILIKTFSEYFVFSYFHSHVILIDKISQRMNEEELTNRRYFLSMDTWIENNLMIWLEILQQTPEEALVVLQHKHFDYNNN